MRLDVASDPVFLLALPRDIALDKMVAPLKRQITKVTHKLTATGCALYALTSAEFDLHSRQCAPPNA